MIVSRLHGPTLIVLLMYDCVQTQMSHSHCFVAVNTRVDLPRHFAPVVLVLLSLCSVVVVVTLLEA